MISKVERRSQVHVRMDKSEHLYLTDYQITEGTEAVAGVRRRKGRKFLESGVEGCL